MRYIVWTVGILGIVLGQASAAWAGWGHHRCCYYYPMAPGGTAMVVPTTVLGAAVPTTVLGGSTISSFGVWPSAGFSTVQVMPTTSSFVLSPNGSGGASNNTDATIASARAAGSSDAMNLLLPILKFFIEKNFPGTGGGGCSCGKEGAFGGAALPEQPAPAKDGDEIEGTSHASEFFISAEKDFQNTIGEIREAQSETANKIAELRKMFPGK